MIGQAESEQFHSAFNTGDGFLKSNNNAWTLLIVVVVGLVLVLLIALRLRRGRWKTGGVASADEDVFKLLCYANELTPHQIFALRDMFFDLKGGNPVALFTCPQLYDAYLKDVSGRRKAIIESVRKAIFAAPERAVRLTTQITIKETEIPPADSISTSSPNRN